MALRLAGRHELIAFEFVADVDPRVCVVAEDREIGQRGLVERHDGTGNHRIRRTVGILVDIELSAEPNRACAGC